MRERIRKPDMGGLLALLLLGVFGTCVLSVLLTGAGAVTRLTERDRGSFARRTAAQYITARVRQAASGVELGTFGGGDALLLREEIDGEVYVTRVYCCGGYIRELFAAEDAGMAPEDGEKILEARDLRFSREPGGGITSEITDTDGETVRLFLAVRGGRGAPS